jgi:hypothetical protein
MERAAGARTGDGGNFMGEDATVQILDLATIERAFPDVPIRIVDDVSEPIDLGAYIVLGVYRLGELVEVVAFAPEDFYNALGKVGRAAMPGMYGERVN